MAEVSVIVPVYQVKQYLRACVDSILAQTFSDFELILVDDGSKDGSGQLCDEYARQDARVRVIHQENGGPSAARNRGLELAAGEYFMFVDSDDTIDPTMLACLHRRITEEQADLAACNYCYCFEDDHSKNFATQVPGEVLSGAEVYYDRKNDRSHGFWTVVWNKLYRSKTLGTLRFPEGKSCEDEFWANDLYQRDIRLVVLPECLCFYRQRANSIMRTPNVRRNFDILEALQARIRVYLRSDQYAGQAYKVLIYSLEYLTESKKMLSTQENREAFAHALEETRDIVRQLKHQPLSPVQRASLAPLEIAPCLTFSIGMKFRGFLEDFL